MTSEKPGSGRRAGVPGKTILLLLVLQILWAGAPLPAFAVSYCPEQLYHRQEKHEASIGAGETVYLFHSGTPDITRSIHPNDILIVRRIDSSCGARKVGEIKVISFVGKTYIKGEVIEGEIRAEDIAQKGKVSCLVIFSGICIQEK